MLTEKQIAYLEGLGYKQLTDEHFSLNGLVFKVIIQDGKVSLLFTGKKERG